MPPTKKLTKVKNDFLFKMNLQLFGESPIEEAASQLMQDLENPPQPEVMPEAEPEISSELEDNPEQPTPEEAENTNQSPELERVEPRVDINEFKNLLDNMRNDIMNNISQIPQLPQDPNEIPEQPPELTDEEMEARNDELYENLMNNPYDTLARIRDEAKEEAKREMMQYVEPLMNERQQAFEMAKMNKEIAVFKNSKPDFDEHVNDMIQIIESEGLQQDPKALEYAYNKAKLSKMPTPKSFNEMLSEEGSIEKIKENKEVWNKLIGDYLESINKGEKPVTVGANANSGVPPLTPPRQEPTTLKQAVLNFMKDHEV